MEIVNKTTESLYERLFNDYADPRTTDWFLMKDPVLLGSILAVYLLFVLKLGPEWMKNRKPFQLQNTIIVYNALQVALSIWLFVESLDGAWLDKYSWRCEPVDRSRSPQAMRICRGVYIFFLAKISELLDTVFFVLRKKDKQVSFLHMYHHTLMPIVSWIVCKYIPGGHEIFIGLVNSFVHVVMYTYYLLAALGPEFQRFLWWKKYITTMQLLQFCLAFLHSSQLVFVDCGYPKWTLSITLPNAIFFYYLFNDFYYKAYGSRKKKSTMKTDTSCKADAANGALSNGVHKVTNAANRANSDTVKGGVDHVKSQ